MNEWMMKEKNKRMNMWMKGLVSEYTGKWMNEWLKKRIKGWKGEWKV